MILSSSNIKYIYLNNAKHALSRSVEALRYTTARSRVGMAVHRTIPNMTVFKQWQTNK